MGTLEVDDSAPELRFVGRNRRRNIVDKSQSYLSLVQGAVILYMSGKPVNTGKISSKKEIQKLMDTKFKDDGLRIYITITVLTQKTSPSFR